jgi:hypothetical protein
MPRIELIEPGTDILQVNTKRPPLKIPWVWTLVVFCVIVVALLFYTRAKADSEKSGQQNGGQQSALSGQPEKTGTVTATLTATPTGSATALMDGVEMPGIEGMATSTRAACAPGPATVKNVEVTRVVAGACSPVKVDVTRVVTVKETVLVPAPTLTAAATQTPWIIEVTRIVEVTPTPTPSPTATITPWVIVVTATPEQTPTQGPSPTPTATGMAATAP